MSRRRPRSTLFPTRRSSDLLCALGPGFAALPGPSGACRPRSMKRGGAARSEEHTSELQSLTNLVCRLLLEKKKQTVDGRPPAMTALGRPFGGSVGSIVH